ncbi:MAG: hypothetical protein V4760_08220 [Bdellovibrionota bacterium]
MEKFSALLIPFLSTFLALPVLGAVDFEGFYEITAKAKHSGFLIERRETIEGGRHKHTRYLAGEGGESLADVYVVDSAFRAVSWSSTSYKNAAVTHTAKFEFANGMVSVSNTAAGKASVTSKMQVPTDVTFDEFIPDFLKAQRGGRFVPGMRMNVVRFVEEPGISVSEVTVGPLSSLGGWKTYSIEVRPRDGETPRSYLVADSGEVVQTKISTNKALLVSSLKEAVGANAMNAQLIEKTFGGIPKGTRVVKAAAAPVKAAAPPAKTAPARPVKK